MLIGTSRLWSAYFYQEIDGELEELTEDNMFNPSIIPMVGLKSDYMKSMHPLLYENDRLYHLYKDAITGEKRRDEVGLASLEQRNLAEAAEQILADYFKNRENNNVSS